MQNHSMLLIDHYEELKQGCVSLLKAAKAVIISKAIFHIVFLTSELPPLILLPHPKNSSDLHESRESF